MVAASYAHHFMRGVRTVSPVPPDIDGGGDDDDDDDDDDSVEEPTTRAASLRAKLTVRKRSTRGIAVGRIVGCGNVR